MLKSNIIAGSNIYYSSDDNPIYCEEFVEQIQDYELLKYINERSRYDYKVIHLNDKQKSIIKEETRCTYAPNDPCWGFSDEKKHIICSCINGNCKYINACNSNYSEKKALFWEQRSSDTLAYGNPEKLKRYYIVDLISTDEMESYKATPENYGNIFITDRIQNKKINRRVRIDPETNKKQVLVGRNWILDIRYEDEICEDIWAYENEIEDEKYTPIVKAEVIKAFEEDNMPTSAHINASSLNKLGLDTEEKYKSTIVSNILNDYNLLELVDENVINDELLIVVSNPSEKGYISNMLSECGIFHGYEDFDSIQIILFDDITELDCKNNIIISNNVFISEDNDDANNIWKLFIKYNCYKLNAPKKDYGSYKYENKFVGICSNQYGVTHICIGVEDIASFDKREEGIYPVELLLEKESYSIVYNDDVIGYTTDKLKYFLEELKKNDEITEIPYSIEGIKIRIIEGNMYLIGMGHLKFVEY